jgi:hypothetical protein
MLKVQALIKYLSENNPQGTPVRLAFYNYLCNLADEEALVDSELLENFFAICLDYAHWQQNRKILGDEIRELLGEHIDPADLKWPEQIQVVELENMTDSTDAIQCYLNSIYKKGEKYRLIMEGEKKMMAIVLMPDQSLCVRSFDRKMIIRHGQLEPLKKDLILHYNSNLELDSQKIQRMEVGPFVTAQFQVTVGSVQGCLVRGYQHQKFFELQGENLGAYPKLFYSIKRIEQYFLQRQSDPFYQETVSALEKTIENMRLNELDSFQEAVDVMARAQNILEHVFSGDKLLNLLIRDLQHTLSQRQNSRVVRTPQKVEESWNPSKASAIPSRMAQQIPTNLSLNLNPQPTLPPAAQRQQPMQPATSKASLSQRIASMKANPQQMATTNPSSTLMTKKTMRTLTNPLVENEVVEETDLVLLNPQKYDLTN